MKVSFDENNLMTIILQGRLDASNAAETGIEMMNDISNASPKEIIFDFLSLEYISSMGLREMLKIKKEFSDIPISIINVNNTIYDIFDATGFIDYFMLYKVGEEFGNKVNHRFGKKLDGVSVKLGYFE